MLLNKLSLYNFKNISEATLEFSPKVNCLLGNNGMGKSNLLDAIYTLSHCRSFCGVTDAMLIKTGADFATLRGSYTRRDTPEELTMAIRPGRRKSLKRGGKEYSRLTEHVGSFPIVMIAPHDIDLIRGTAEERRRWMDMVISQSSSRYLDALLRYGTALEQRNRMLRDGIVDHTLYDAVETVMDMAAQFIADSRRRFTAELTPMFASRYNTIAGHAPGEGEIAGLDYQSWQGDNPEISLRDLLDSARRHDEIVRHTSVGPHRDDIDMTLNSMSARRTASQGQCKTFTVALRLAQYEFLHKATGMKPLLLLDDVFDKLDASRVEHIMKLATSRSSFGQIFITDTNRTHLDDIMNITGGDYRMWEVSNGTFTPHNSATPI